MFSVNTFTSVFMFTSVYKFTSVYSYISIYIFQSFMFVSHLHQYLYVDQHLCVSVYTFTLSAFTLRHFHQVYISVYTSSVYMPHISVCFSVYRFIVDISISTIITLTFVNLHICYLHYHVQPLYISNFMLYLCI